MLARDGAVPEPGPVVRVRGSSLLGGQGVRRRGRRHYVRRAHAGRGDHVVWDGHDGPVANICQAGLAKVGKGPEQIEKAIENAGSLEMAFLEKNMIWLNTVITVAPMIGFTGTVVGMIGAFDAIKAANDISPAVVAGGISQALLTTAFGLIVAMIIQFFQNFFVSRIDQLILDMEENSVRLLDSMHTKN